MRILLTNHVPFQTSVSGALMRMLAQGLISSGDQAECLIVDRVGQGEEPFPVHRVVCSEKDSDAGAAAPLPSFTSVPSSHVTFDQLTDPQIGAYRSQLRKGINRVVDALDPQIIHCLHLWVQGALVLETGVPYVLSAQSTNLLGVEQDPRYREWAEQAAENAGRIIANSFWMANEICQRFDVEPNRVATVRHGVDCDAFQAEGASPRELAAQLGLPEGPIILFSGKLMDVQGGDVLLHAAADYESRIEDSVTILAGDGPRLADWKRLADELKLRRVFFLGDRSRLDLVSLYRAAKLMVLPTRVDPFEIAYLEAFAAGTPVVSCRVGAMAEIIYEEIGGFVQPDDPTALADMITQAVQEDWKSSKGPLARLYAVEQHNLTDWVSR
ncbi:MAG: glycosyltransferase, partial [Planctomycetales bacterium]